MPKRTTILLEEDLYQKLIEESLKKYKSTRALSKIINELLRKALRDESQIINILLSEKLVKVTSKDFEEFRRELSKRFES